MAGTTGGANDRQSDLVLDALGDPTRRTILEIVADGPIAVGEVAARLPVSRPAVSRHLKLLARAGLVTSRAEGTRRLYDMDSEGVEAARAYFEDLWSQATARFALVADNLARDNPGGPPSRGDSK